jgi:transcription antitermination factor NusG
MEEKNNQQKEMTIDELARIVQGGFLDLKSDIKEIKEDTENIKADLNKKVDKVDHNTLIYRVEKLEKKFV